MDGAPPTARIAAVLIGVIDIGSNTTRLLIADAGAGRLEPLLQRRHFTRLGVAAGGGGEIPPAKVEELAGVVAEQAELARRHGVAELAVVATAALREAANAAQAAAAVERAAGAAPRILSESQEAELAFLGATATFEEPLPGRVGVVDVGGGSTELAVGRAGEGVEWSASLPIGSSGLSERLGARDPPAPEALAAARREAAAAASGLDAVRPQTALAVGGSATSMRRLAGGLLDGPAIEAAFRLLERYPADEIAARYDLDPVRVRLLPAGLAVLGAVAEAWRTGLRISRGGVREGVALERAAAARAPGKPRAAVPGRPGEDPTFVQRGFPAPESGQT